MDTKVYITAPAAILRHKEISAGEKILYLEILNLCKAKGYCWASNEYLSKLQGTTPTTASVQVKSLADKKLISLSYQRMPSGKGTRRIIKLVRRDFLTGCLSLTNFSDTEVDSTISTETVSEQPRSIKRDQPTIDLSTQLKVALDDYMQQFQEQLDEVKQLIAVAPKINQPQAQPPEVLPVSRQVVFEHTKVKGMPVSKQAEYWNNAVPNITKEIIEATKQTDPDTMRETIADRGINKLPTDNEIYKELETTFDIENTKGISKKEKENKAISWMLLASLFNFKELTNHFRGKESAKSLLACIDYFNSKGTTKTPEQWRMSVLVWLDQEKLLCSKSDSNVDYNAKMIIDLCREEYRQAIRLKRTGPKIDEAYEEHLRRMAERNTAKLLETV